MYYAYILKSLKNNRYYYGSCEDIEKRLETHNNGLVKSTKGRRPFILHYKETFANRSDAFKREQFFKTIEGYRFLKEQGII